MGDVPVRDVTPAMIDSTFAVLRCGGGLHGRPLSTGTLPRVRVVLRAAFSQAMSLGLVWDDPGRKMDPAPSVASLPHIVGSVRCLMDQH